MLHYPTCNHRTSYEEKAKLPLLHVHDQKGKDLQGHRQAGKQGTTHARNFNGLQWSSSLSAMERPAPLHWASSWDTLFLSPAQWVYFPAQKVLSKSLRCMKCVDAHPPRMYPFLPFINLRWSADFLHLFVLLTSPTLTSQFGYSIPHPGKQLLQHKCSLRCTYWYDEIVWDMMR